MQGHHQTIVKYLFTLLLTVNSGYSMFAKITYNKLGSLAVKSAIILNNFGICCAYFRIFGDVCSSLVYLLIQDKTSFFVTNWNNFFYVICVCLLMLPFIFKDNIESLKNVSFLGVLGITIFIISIISIFIYKMMNDLILPFDAEMLYPSGELLEKITKMPTIFVAFTFQFNAFPIYFSLKKRENKQMVKATTIGVIFCLMIYLLTGILGFFMYRDKLTNTVLDNLREEMTQNFGKDKFISIVLFIVNVSFLISSTMSIPLMFFSLKKNFLNTILLFKRGKKVTPQEALLPLLKNETNEEKSLISDCAKFWITIGLYISLCIVTITVKYMGEIFDIVGSTAGNAINYIFPNLFLLKLSHTMLFSRKNIISQFLCVGGFLVLILCLVSEILKLSGL